MKGKLIVVLLFLALIVGVAVCLNGKTSADTTVAEAQPTEQQKIAAPEEKETPVGPSNAEPQAAETVVQTEEPISQEEQVLAKDNIPKSEENPETQPEQPQESDTSTTDESELPEGTLSTPEESENTTDYLKELADSVSRYEEMLLDGAMPDSLRFIIESNAKDTISAYDVLLKDGSISGEDMAAAQNYLSRLKALITDPSNVGETEELPVEEEPVEDPYVPPTPLTDEEVQKVVNDYLDNFKTTVDMSDWDEEAIEKLDENIEIVKNDTPYSISRTIKDYQAGYTTKEDVEFEIRIFLKKGGYGSQEITVQ